MNAPLADLFFAIGVQLTLRLVAERGGQRVYIPRLTRLTDDCPLARIVGVAATAKLTALWPGEWMAIPRAMAYVRRMRDRDIRTRYAANETAAALAREFELSERQVYAIVAQGAEVQEPGPDGKPAAQLALFG